MSTTFTASVQSLPDQFAAGPDHELLVRSGVVVLCAVTAATDLTPTIAVSKTSVAASMTMDTDYISVSMDR